MRIVRVSAYVSEWDVDVWERVRTLIEIEWECVQACCMEAEWTICSCFLSFSLSLRLLFLPSSIVCVGKQVSLLASEQRIVCVKEIGVHEQQAVIRATPNFCVFHFFLTKLIFRCLGRQWLELWKRDELEERKNFFSVLFLRWRIKFVCSALGAVSQQVLWSKWKHFSFEDTRLATVLLLLSCCCYSISQKMISK